MIHATLQWAAQAMQGQLIGQNTTFSGVSTDTRALKAGELFFCLMGQRDGHDFIPQAVEKNCAALIVDQAHQAEIENRTIPIIVVGDTLKALGDLAQAWRQKFSIPLIALTGSNGKTTTKEFLSAILSTRYRVMATEGNYNNLIGVPKTLFRLSESDEIAVIEMGMNDFGEIQRLTEIARPTMGLITNIAPAHLEKLGSVEGVAQAKGELFAGLGPKAVAIVNLSDPRVAKLSTQAQTIEVGVPDSKFWGEVLPSTQADRPLQVKIHTAQTNETLAMKLPGAHHLENILLALAVGDYFKIPLSQAIQALADFTPAPSRMERIALAHGKTLIDDCYNANPASTQAALKTLGELKKDQKALAILGEMNELGDFTKAAHIQVGEAAAKQGVEYLIAIGQHAKETLAGAEKGGMKPHQLQSFRDVTQAQSSFEKFPQDVSWILVKGSRSNQLENLVLSFKETS